MYHSTQCLPMRQYSFNPVNKDGSLKCSQRHSIAGHNHLKACGRGCIYITNKPWSICHHNTSVNKLGHFNVHKLN